MVASRQHAALLLVAAALLLLNLQTANAACCTFGQPTYSGSAFSPSIVAWQSCSDGPCSGPGFDYRGLPNVVESTNPNSCCYALNFSNPSSTPNISDPVNGFYYNPQQGSRYPNGSFALWAAALNGPLNQTFPGTGRTCNISEPRWQCTLNGIDVPTCQDTNLTEGGSQQFKCPDGWVFDNTSSSTILTKEECCLPQPSLAIISRFPPEYTGITANLTADHTADKELCEKFPSQRESVSVTILQPGAGKCGKNSTGFVQPGTYTLDEGKAPKDTVFKRWECYNITLGVQGTPVIVESITLAGNSSVTCVAVFDLLPLPELALISLYPPGYGGKPANLSAISDSSTCVKAPSQELNKNNVTITQPGPAMCNNGTMPVGTYDLEATAPAGLEFNKWVCYDVLNTTSFVVRNPDAQKVLLERDDIVTCVAEFEQKPQLALTSRFPDNYNGTTANLSAKSFSDSCTKAPSARQDRNNVTVLQPGPGQCGVDGFVDQGFYVLNQTAPVGTTFIGWKCYDITNGTMVQPSTTPFVSLSGNKSVSCVAEYNYTAPLPSPSPSPSPTPLPILAIISEFPDNYTGPTANLTAISNNNDTCVEAPSARLNATNNVTIISPGAGFCNNDGKMPPGNYSFTQTPPPGTVFVEWVCYEITGTNKTVLTSGKTPVVDLSGTKQVTCNAKYELAPTSPSPSPSPSPNPLPSPSPSPSPTPGPKFALVADFPSEYSSSLPTANLTATSNTSICDESPSARLGVNNVTITMPGAGFCNPQNDGNMPPGTYNLSQVAPRNTKFERWDCYNVTAGMLLVPVNISNGVVLQGTDSITCVAKYQLVDPTCGDVLPGTPGAQPYNCSRPTMARNESAAASSPPSDPLCCQPTCADTSVIMTAAVPWVCPANTTLASNAAMLYPPSDAMCCVAQNPFLITKTGPALVKSGQSFNFDVQVVFKAATFGVNITDDLPIGLVPGGSPATWTATSSISGNPTSGTCATSATSPEITCNLGASVSWAVGDIVRVTVPVRAIITAGGNLTNVANVFDVKNQTASTNVTVEVCKDCGVDGECFDAFKTGPSTVQAGQIFDFKVAVRFFFKPAGPVTVTDTLPTGLQATSGPATWKATYANGSTLAQQCLTSANTFSCSLGPDWHRGDVVEITMPVLATAGASGNVVNQAVVTDGNLTKKPEHPLTIAPAAASPFTITKVGPSQPVLAGQSFSYTILVSFLGTSTGVKIQDVLPAQVISNGPATWTSSKSSTPTPCLNTNSTQVTINCDLGMSTVWNAGETAEVKVPVTAGLSAANNVLNTAIVSDDKGRTKNDTFPVTINVDDTSPFLITKSGPTRVEQNAPFNFEVTVVFMSSTTAARIVDTMPPGLWPAGTATWTATSNNGVTNGVCASTNRTGSTGDASYNCDLGSTVTWAKGDRVKVTVPTVATTIAQPLVNRAVVTDGQGRTANATATVIADLPNIPQNAMRIEKNGPTTPVTIGQAFTFTIRANFDQAGPFTAAKIVDDLPVGLLPGSTAATWTARNNNQQLSGTCVITPNTSPEITCDLGANVSWIGGDVVDVTVPVIAGNTAGTNLVNKATITATLAGRTLTLDDTAAVTVTVPVLKVSKLGPGVTVAANTSFPWTITAGVTGDGSVNPLIMVDELPSTDIKFVPPVPNNCVLNNDQRVTCTWNEVVSSGNDKVVQLTAIASKAGTYTNRATVFTNNSGIANQTTTATVTVEERQPGFSPAPPVEVIEVTKKGPTQAVEAGQEFTFTLTPAVKSGGVTSMVLTDTIDASTGVSFLRVSPSTGCTVEPQLLKCTLNAPFGALTLTAKATKAGTFTNRVEVRSPGGATDTDQADVTVVVPGQETCATWVAKNGCGANNVLNPNKADTLVTSNSTVVNRLLCCQPAVPQGVPDMSIKKTANKATVNQGDRFTYTFEVKNLGSLDPDSQTAYNVIATDSFPVGISPTGSYTITPDSVNSACTFSGTSNRNMRCVLGTLKDKEIKNINVEAIADGTNFGSATAPGASQKLTNNVKLQCSNSATASAPDPACDKTTKTDVAVIKGPNNQNSATITKSASPSSGPAGTVFTFTIVVSPKPAGSTVNNVIMTDPIPSQLTNAQLLTTFGGKCSITSARRARAAVTNPVTPRSGGSAIDDVFNAIRRGNKKDTVAPGNNKGKRQGLLTQQTLRCNFGTISSPQEIRFTATGNTLGTVTNVATVTFTGSDSPQEARTTVTITNPPRQQGSCCDGNYNCNSNVDQSTCESSGGTWSSSSTACKSKLFCSGACCTGGGTAAASCRITKKNKCSGGLFGSQPVWDPNGDCNDAGFCPKPTQCMEKCQECDYNNPCCPGLSCLPAGNCWWKPRYICCQTRYYKTYKAQLAKASAAAATSAAEPAATTAAMQTYATPADVKNTFCSKIGGLCGRNEDGRQCCGPRADCVVGDGLLAKCVSRDTCKPEGSKCSGPPGQCCAGFTCQQGRCARAECKTPSGCLERDYLCKYTHELNCEAYFAAATSSVDV